MKAKLTGYIVDNGYGKWLDEYDEENITPKKVADVVEKANDLNEPLEVEFSSMGGMVSSASEIIAELQKVKNGTVGILSGLIASAGSTIACAFGKTKMYDYSELMIHNPRITTGWGMTLRPQEVKEIANMLDAGTTNLVNIYTKKTGLSEDKIREYLDNETFFTANEAKDLGFVDEVLPVISNSVGSMPKISYQDLFASADEKFANLTKEYKGANMPNENKLVENGVVEEATTESTEETTESTVEETVEEVEETEEVVEETVEETSTEEPTMADVLSAITALTGAVAKLTENSAQPAVKDEVEETPVEDKPAVEDVFHVGADGKQKANIATTERKLNRFGLDVTGSVI
jgi:ATP-dependent protease ClpP protease subunit